MRLIVSFALRSIPRRRPHASPAFDSPIVSGTVRIGSQYVRKERELTDQSLLLGLLAASLHSAAYWFYVTRMRRGHSQPHPTSWLIWVGLTTMNAVTAFDITGKPLLSLQYVAGALGAGIVCWHLKRTAQFTRPTRREQLVIGLSALAIAARILTGDPNTAPWFIALAILVSSQPTMERAYANPRAETALPWMLWIAAFTTTGVNNYLEGAAFTAYVVPITGVLVDTTIAFLCSTWRTHSQASTTNIARRLT